MPFTIIRNDITKVKADAIVNTANPHPTYGSGTDYAIYEASGKEKLLAARKKIGEIARGQAAETPAFALPAKYIIHTVGPVWEGGDKGEYDILRSCYENSLLLALKLKCRSIAFPLIAAGAYGFPRDKALQTAISVIQPFVMNHSMKVILVVFGQQSLELSGRLVDNIRQYVDINYVKQAHRREYSVDALAATDLLPDEKVVRQRRLRRSPESDTSLMMSEIPIPDAIYPESATPSEKKPAPRKGKVDISELIASSEKTFQEKLFEIIDERGLTGPQVYKNYISKQVYSKIQADRDYHPNKFTAIALCLSLHLNLEETKDLIGRAGWTLSPSNKADLVVAGCIMNEEYNLVQINIILFDFDCPVLEKIK